MNQRGLRSANICVLSKRELMSPYVQIMKRDLRRETSGTSMRELLKLY